MWGRERMSHIQTTIHPAIHLQQMEGPADTMTSVHFMLGLASLSLFHQGTKSPVFH